MPHATTTVNPNPVCYECETRSHEPGVCPGPAVARDRVRIALKVPREPLALHDVSVGNDDGFATVKGLVGGYLDITPLPGGLYLYADEDGAAKRLPANFAWDHGGTVLGPVVFVRRDRVRLGSLTDADLAWIEGFCAEQAVR